MLRSIIPYERANTCVLTYFFSSLLDKPALPVSSPAPLPSSTDTTTGQTDLAVRWSRTPAGSAGSGSELFIFVRDTSPASEEGAPGVNAPPHPAAGLTLCDFSGQLVQDCSTLPVENGCAGASIALNPGAYLLRVERPGYDDLEQTVVTCPGWQTQVFLPREMLSTSEMIPRPNLEDAAVLMGPLGQGFVPEVEEAAWVEMARVWLARGEPVVPLAEMQAGVEVARALRAQAPDGDMLRQALRAKYANPMLGIYAAHLMMIAPNPDESLLREVADYLKIMLGDHPDVTAVDLWLGPSTPVPPFLAPPMLRSSWNILVNRSRTEEGLVAQGSYTLRITGRLWGAGAWLVWRRPLAAPEEAATAPAIDLNILSEYVRKRLARSTPSELVRHATADKGLTGVESDVLSYVANVVQSPIRAKDLSVQLENVGRLGPLKAIYRKVVPSDLERRVRKDAEDSLTSDTIVQTLNIPQAAVIEATHGLFQKLGLKQKGKTRGLLRRQPVVPPGPRPPERPPAVQGARPTPVAAMGPGEIGQEIRFAVVMYGGISLAIYMHGVAQELLRLVRATSGANLGGDEVAQIYRDLSTKVRDQRPSLAGDPSAEQRVPTRFVVDILSGTSAGGINAVFLAKALAIRSQDLDHLRRMWLDKADIDKILNRGGAFEPKRSLLNGGWMYEQLHDAFRDMNAGPCDSAAGYAQVEQLDLFVTTTDLNGVWIPLQLADMNVPEKVHRGCFNFRYDNVVLAGGSSAKPVDPTLDELRRDDFVPETDAMLAFACRCTSSFPIAFAPMKLADIAPVIGRADYAQYVEHYTGFFGWIPSRRLVDIERPVTIEERELADGGYLDNKPFDHAIDAMTFRATRRRHTRKLLFVDPFPEDPAATSDRSHFDFIDNTIAGSITLPHAQPIRDQINRVKASNRVQARLQKVQDRTMPGGPPGEFPIAAAVVDLAGPDRYGSIYTAYHAVRLLDCTDDLARTFGGLPASVQAEDAQLAVRYLVRAWRERTYAPDTAPGRELETEFFDRFDFSFRMRRAVHLLEWAQGPAFRNGDDLGPRNPALCDLLARHLTRLHRRREQLSLSGGRNLVWSDIEPLGQVVTRDRITWLLEPIDDENRLARAHELVGNNRDKFHRAAAAVSRSWDEVFRVNRGELNERRAGDPDLDRQYRFFDYHDMVSLAFLEGSDVSEHTETEIYRISPADGIKRSLAEKLAGYRVQAFGAFLKREWRENDILWGRLDACKRLVSAILTDPRDGGLRSEFVRRLQDAIVRQEAGLRSSQDLAPALQAIREHCLTDYLETQYRLPPDPPPSDSARRLAYAVDIFGRMVEEDVSEQSRVKGVLRKNRLTSLLRSAGGVGAQLVGLLTPGTLGRIFWNYWLALVALASGLLLVYAGIAGDNHARILGNRGLGATVVVWFLSWVAGQLLARPRIPFWIRSLKWLLVIVGAALVIAVAALVVIGLRHLHDVLGVWPWIPHWVRLP